MVSGCGALKMYKTYTTPMGKVMIVRTSDGGTFPDGATDNTDYQAYLKWLEEGNTPLSADE